MVTPPLVAGMGLLFLLGREAPVGGVLTAAGFNLLFSPTGIVLAQVYVAASIIVRSARSAFQAVDPDYAGMASTLGLTPTWSFLLVEIPMAGRGLLSAAILGWARALGEFGATLMVAGATRLYTETLPMAIYLNIASGENQVAIACALILLVISTAPAPGNDGSVPVRSCNCAPSIIAPTGDQPICRAENGNGRRWPEPWPVGPDCCCSTNRSAAWMRRPNASFGWKSIVCADN